MKSENEMSDEELQELENSTTVVEDRLDRLELIRKLLDSSRLEQMYIIKRSQKLGPLCPYYKTARRLWEKDQEREIIIKLREVLGEFEDVI